MSIVEIKSELDRLSPEERRRVTAYLVIRDRMLDPDFRGELIRLIDDQNPGHWVSVEDAEKRLLS